MSKSVSAILRLKKKEELFFVASHTKIKYSFERVHYTSVVRRRKSNLLLSVVFFLRTPTVGGRGLVDFLGN